MTEAEEHEPADVLTDWAAGQEMLGACVSFTVTRKEQVLVKPDSSVARHTTVVWPFGKMPPLAMPLCRLGEFGARAQLSLAEGVE